MIIKTGVRIRYCGHDASFVADVYEVGNARVVRHNGPMRQDDLIRPAGVCDYWMVDFPKPGFWRPELGIFVVPQEQLKDLEPSRGETNIVRDFNPEAGERIIP